MPKLLQLQGQLHRIKVDYTFLRATNSPGPCQYIFTRHISESVVCENGKNRAWGIFSYIISSTEPDEVDSNSGRWSEIWWSQRRSLDPTTSSSFSFRKNWECIMYEKQKTWTSLQSVRPLKAIQAVKTARTFCFSILLVAWGHLDANDFSA